MASPRDTTSYWREGIGQSNEFLRNDEYELYQTEDAFVLTIEMPGFETDEIDVSWNDGILNVAAEHDDENRGRRRTYHRRFRVPKRVDEEAIRAEYTNGVLEVGLPIQESQVTGREIPVQ